MALFRGEEISQPKVTDLEAPVRADANLINFSFANTPWSGVSLTAKDVPLMAWVDFDGDPHVLVAQDSDDSLQVRS